MSSHLPICRPVMQCLLLPLLSLVAGEGPAAKPVPPPGSAECPVTQRLHAGWSRCCLPDQGPAGRIIGLTPDGAAARAGVRVGDELLAVGPWRVDDPLQLSSALDHLPADTDQMTVTVRRDGAEQTVTISPWQPLRRLGIDLDPLPELPRSEERLPRVFAEAGLSPAATMAELLGRRLPAGYLRRLRELTRSKADLRWLPRWHDGYAALLAGRRTAARGHFAAITSEPTDPRWAALLRYQRLLAEGNDAGALAAVDPLTALIAHPWPITVPALGDGGGAQGSVAELLRNLHASDGQATAAIRATTNFIQFSGTTPAVGYLRTLQLAIADPERCGGWPFRNVAIFTPQRRAVVRAELDAPTFQDDPFLTNFGRIMLATLDGDSQRSVALLEELRARSPFAARLVSNSAIMAERYHRTEAVSTAIRQWCREQGLEIRDDTIVQRLQRRYDFAELLSEGPLGKNWQSFLDLDHNWVRHGVSSLVDEGGWPAQVAAALRGTSNSFNHLSWELAVHPVLREERRQAAGPLRWLQLALPTPEANTMDSVAALLAVTGRYEEAHRWESAIALVAPDHSDGSLFAQRAQLFAKRQTLPEVGQMPNEQRPVPGGRMSMKGQQRHGAATGSASSANGSSISVSGYFLDNQRIGPWLWRDAAGVVRERLWYSYDRVNGPWESYDEQGRLRLSGWYVNGQAVGHWRYHDAAGRVVAEGAYLDDHRVGPWRWLRPDGTTSSEGSYDRNGKPIGTWIVDGRNQAVPTPPTDPWKSLDFTPTNKLFDLPPKTKQPGKDKKKDEKKQDKPKPVDETPPDF